MLGDTLRQAREAKNLTLKDVESNTNIRIHYLEAIEKGDYAQIKSQVYLKGFIKTYAKFLELDDNAILEQYYNEQKITPPEPLANVKEQSEKEIPTEQMNTFKKTSSPTKKQSEKKVTEKKPSVTKNNNKKVINLIFGSIIGIIIISCITYFSFSFFDNPKPKNTVTTSEPVAKEEPVKEDTANQIKGVHLSADFTAPCWVQVTADGKVIFTKTVQKGSVLKWDAKKDIMIRLGNAAAANITFNGKNVGTLGQEGSVVEQTFTAQIPDTDENTNQDIQSDNTNSTVTTSNYNNISSAPSNTPTTNVSTTVKNNEPSNQEKSSPKANNKVEKKAPPEVKSEPIEKKEVKNTNITPPTPTSESAKKQ